MNASTEGQERVVAETGEITPEAQFTLFRGYEAIGAQYARLRGTSRRIGGLLLKSLSKNALKAAAEKLGMWEDGTIVFGNMDHTAVLADYAIYDCAEDGMNAVERYAAKHPAAPGSDEHTVLAAMKEAYFSLFRMEEHVEGVGAWVQDVLSDSREFLADVGMSLTVPVGMVLASRVLPYDGFITTGGAALPVELDVLAKALEVFDKWTQRAARAGGAPTSQEASDFNAEMIRLCLQSEAANRIAYVGPEDIEDDSDEEVYEEDEGYYVADRPEPISAGPRIGRNDPCPCGSGKKYKKCCGR